MKRFKKSNDINDINEFKILKELESPYIIKVFESFLYEENFCFIMEYCQVIYLFLL